MNQKERIWRYSLIIGSGILFLILGVFGYGWLRQVTLVSHINISVHDTYINNQEPHKEELSILVLANEDYTDEMGYEEEPEWLDRLDKKMSHIDLDYIALNGGGYLWGWQLYKQNKLKEYDLIIIEEENHSIDDRYLVQLLVDVLADHENALLVLVNSDENGLEVDGEESIVHDSLSKMSSVLQFQALSVDDMIELIDEEFIINNQEALDMTERQGSIEEIREEFSLWTQLDFRPEPVSHGNFSTYGNLIVSTEKNALLRYKVDEAYTLITYLEHPAGGLMSVYIDEVLMETVDTWGEHISTKVLVYDTRKGSQVDILSSSYKDQYVGMARVAFAR